MWMVLMQVLCIIFGFYSNRLSSTKKGDITTNQLLIYMSKNIVFKSENRGHANHGWLDAHHSFSFANFYNPKMMGFGVLRVLNDDVIAGGMGFGRHPHDNMEIITIPLEGALEHQDSMGNTAVIYRDEVQIMSAGTGVFHSEKNKNADEPLKLLQIWLYPKERDIEPRYDQKKFLPEDRINKLQQVVAPNGAGGGVHINQDAWFLLGNLKKDFKIGYAVQKVGNGVYAFVISGEVVINGNTLLQRDALGIWETEKLDIKASSDCEILLMDIPM
jgi:quercetin 2,3-dioxygenase